MKKAFLAFCFMFIPCAAAFSVRVPTGQSVGSLVRGYADRHREERTLERIGTPRRVSPALNAPEIKRIPYGKSTAYITSVIIQYDVKKAESLRIKDLDHLTERYKNRELSVSDMKELASAVSRYYYDRKKDITAYVPRQYFAEHILYINLTIKNRSS